MLFNSSKLFIACLVTAGLAGCGALPKVEEVLPDKKVEYKKSRQAGKNLEIPPDLTKSSINDELVIPDAPRGDSSTLSGFMQTERIQSRSTRQATVLPKIENIEVKRDGDQRWLVINASPDDVWFKTIGFWQDNGILLAEQDPTVGIMLTDWLENSADIKNDFITDTIRSVFDGLYSASSRDQFRVRIEPVEGTGTTELYLTHRGMQETIIQSQGDVERTVWNPRETDHGLEAEMLRRLMVHMGVADQQASRSLARKGSLKPRSQLNRSSSAVALQIDEGFSRAWRLTGVALDRVGFAVEDRDRTKGVYYVRYNDPLKDVEEPGLLDKLAFWRDSDQNIDKESQYQVSLNGQGAKTDVVVLSKDGTRDNSETALRILTLLNEQIQ
ncbi:MAG: outer membrane protein assembly factor BamC [Candidatus Sedimenticola sp. PURPLELP]